MQYVTRVERMAERRGLLKGIESCLKLKFGAEGLRLLPEIRNIDDLGKLYGVLQTIETVPTLKDCRQAMGVDSGEPPASS